MKLRFFVIIGLLFILTGLLLSSQLIISCYQRTSACPLTSAGAIETTNPILIKQTPQAKADTTGFPVHLAIPGVSINLDVAPGIYNADKRDWTIGNDKAYFATVTSQPNTTAGITYIYGHNRSNIFHNLLDMPTGTSATITTDNGHSFTYEFISERNTSPDDVSVLSYSGAPILTLQTCTGWFDQNRSLFTFKLKEVS